MEKRPTLIIFSLSRWDQPISSSMLSLAKVFAQETKVFYIDHPYSWKDLLWEWRSEAVQKRKKALLQREDIFLNPQDFPENLTVVTPPLSFPINFIPDGALYRFISKRNDRGLFATIGRILKEHQIDEWIYINSFDPFFGRVFPKDLKPLLRVYQCMDDISEVSYSARHGTRLQKEIIQEFDLSLCTSKELTRICSAYTENAYYHPNAAEVKLFSQALDPQLERPEDFRDFGGKIIGFTGSIEYRTDFDLLLQLAQHHQDKSLVFIGPINGPEMKESGLLELPNVHWLGAKAIDELPSYLKFMDVVIIPFRKTKLTKSIYPLKINEYLGAGKAVVSTHFSEDIYGFRDVAYVAENATEFIASIDRALEEDSPERCAQRVAKASENTWAARARQFWDIVKDWQSKE